MRREWIEISCSAMISALSSSLPPCGGSGLKWIGDIVTVRDYVSPSMRREWIEIVQLLRSRMYTQVSLHAEGVD